MFDSYGETPFQATFKTKNENNPLETILFPQGMFSSKPLLIDYQQ